MEKNKWDMFVWYLLRISLLSLVHLVYWLVILIVKLLLDESCGDRHWLLLAEWCCKREASRLLLQNLALTTIWLSYLLLIRVVDFYIVQDHWSFFVLALVNTLLIWTHEGHLKVTFSGAVKSLFTDRRPFALQVIVDIEAFPKACHWRMLLFTHKAWIWSLEFWFEHNRTFGSWGGSLNFKVMMWWLTDLACK